MTEAMIERIVLWPLGVFSSIAIWALLELQTGEWFGMSPDRLLQSVGRKIQITAIGYILWILILYAL